MNSSKTLFGYVFKSVYLSSLCTFNSISFFILLRHIYIYIIWKYMYFTITFATWKCTYLNACICHLMPIIYSWSYFYYITCLYNILLIALTELERNWFETHWDYFMDWAWWVFFFLFFTFVVSLQIYTDSSEAKEKYVITCG